ncbi:MAG: hypothetical protein MJ237_00660 [bacterium]|nr:hypothetical protein [bacterium]
MTNTPNRHLRIVTNEDLLQKQNETEIVPDKNNLSTNSIGYSTNPMYEKLLSYKYRSQKKRLTVEDLLKW